jgi:hypothetical protein
VEVAVSELPPPISFQVCWCGGKTKENKRHAVERDTIPKDKGGALKRTQVRALKVGRYISALGEKMRHGTAEETVAPKGMMALRIF